MPNNLQAVPKAREVVPNRIEVAMLSLPLKKTKDITEICHDVTTQPSFGPCGKKEQNSASAELLPLRELLPVSPCVHAGGSNVAIQTCFLSTMFGAYAASSGGNSTGSSRTSRVSSEVSRSSAE